MIEFDAATHTYTLGGKRVPSVTRIIRDILAPNEYATVPPAVLAHAAARGSAVDKMIELDLRDELDVDSLDAELLPYWQAWERFPDRLAWRKEGPTCQRIVGHPVYGYAGTLDIYLPMSRCLIDVKCTARLPDTVGIQTAAYAVALGTELSLSYIKRYCLHVAYTGCRLMPYADSDDARVFLAALAVHNWREHHAQR